MHPSKQKRPHTRMDLKRIAPKLTTQDPHAHGPKQATKAPYAHGPKVAVGVAMSPKQGHLGRAAALGEPKKQQTNGRQTADWDG